MGNVVVGGLNDFIFFNAHFLSVDIFQGKGGCKVVRTVNCFITG